MVGQKKKSLLLAITQLLSEREMERATTISPSLSQNYLLCPSRAFTTRLNSFSTTRSLSPSSSSSIKVYLSLLHFFLIHCFYYQFLIKLSSSSDPFLRRFSIPPLLYLPVPSMAEPPLLVATPSSPIRLPGSLYSQSFWGCVFC